MIAQRDKRYDNISKKLDQLSIEEKCEFLKNNYGVEVPISKMIKICQMRALKGIDEFHISVEEQNKIRD